MPPSSRTTMRLEAARDGVQIMGMASAAAPAATVLSALRREALWEVGFMEGSYGSRTTAQGSKRPGLKRWSGSKACFTARIIASSTGDL